MNCILINCTGETFTPTKSGALCTWIWEMCQSAKREGIEPLVITRTSDAEPYHWPRTVFLSYPWIPNFRGTGIGRLIKIQQQLTGWGHARQKEYALKVVRAIRTAGAGGLPMVLQNDPEMAVFLRWNFPDAFILHLFQNANPCNKRFRAEFSRSVNVAVAVSEHCAKWNADYFGGEVGVFYNAVDTGRFSPASTPPPGPPVINFVGRTDRQKAPDLLLRAAKLLSERTKDFEIQILGSRFYGWSEPDPYQIEIESLAKEVEQSGIPVRRPGFISRHLLPDELRKAHINVVPSRWDDPCALVTLEGMACGLATIGSRTGGTPEIIGEAGLLFERDSVEQLTAHLYELVTDRDLRVSFGHKARERAEEFTWDKSWRELKGLLKMRPGKMNPSEPGPRSLSPSTLSPST
jgi:glycosyltransferase involved in cell wall biosynthesis